MGDLPMATTPDSAAGAGSKRPRVLFPAPGEEPDDGDAAELVEADAEAGEGDEVAVKDEGGGSAGPKRKRSRTKAVNEGDCKELKPRHLKGKRREEVVARQVANRDAAKKRRTDGKTLEEDLLSAGERLQAQLIRLLRPKARRWAMYEWFYSPVDFGWFRENAFLEVLQVMRACGGNREARFFHYSPSLPPSPPPTGRRPRPRDPPNTHRVVVCARSHRPATPFIRRLPPIRAYKAGKLSA